MVALRRADIFDTFKGPCTQSKQHRMRVGKYIVLPVPERCLRASRHQRTANEKAALTFAAVTQCHWIFLKPIWKRCRFRSQWTGPKRDLSQCRCAYKFWQWRVGDLIIVTISRWFLFITGKVYHFQWLASMFLVVGKRPHHKETFPLFDL